MSERSSASIARRLQDPLAELVKIDRNPSVWVSTSMMLNPEEAMGKPERRGEDCVNRVGVDLNPPASPSLLEYVSGISGTVASNIVKCQEANGRFRNRKNSQRCRHRTKAFNLSAPKFPADLRRRREPLDATAVHRKAMKRPAPSHSDFGIQQRRTWQTAVFETWPPIPGALPQRVSGSGKGAARRRIPGTQPGSLRERKRNLNQPQRAEGAEPPPKRKGQSRPPARRKSARQPGAANGGKRRIGEVPRRIFWKSWKNRAVILRRGGGADSPFKRHGGQDQAGHGTEGLRPGIVFGAFVDIGVHQDGLVHLNWRIRFATYPLWTW